MRSLQSLFALSRVPCFSHIKISDFGLSTGFHWAHDMKYYESRRKAAMQLIEKKLDEVRTALSLTTHPLAQPPTPTPPHSPPAHAAQRMMLNRRGSVLKHSSKPRTPANCGRSWRRLSTAQTKRSSGTDRTGKRRPTRWWAPTTTLRPRSSCRCAGSRDGRPHGAGACAQLTG